MKERALAKLQDPGTRRYCGSVSLIEFLKSL